MDLTEATMLALQNKLTEVIDGQMSIDENGLPVLENPYNFMKRPDGLYQISSRRSYDLADYSYAVSITDDINEKWRVFKPNPDYSVYMSIERRPKQYLLADTVQGWNEAVNLMKKIDSGISSNIDRT